MNAKTEDPTHCGASGCGPSDLAGSPLSLLLVWGFPAIAFLAGFFNPHEFRPFLWITALTVAGGACLLNAFRCRRMHCFFSGPYFLICAGFVALGSLGIIPVEASMWSMVGVIIVMGGLVAYFLPEKLWGRYASSSCSAPP